MIRGLLALSLLVMIVGCFGPSYRRLAYGGAVLGAGAGGVIGYNMAGRDSTDRWRGAAYGAAAGAFAGYLLGSAVEQPAYEQPAQGYYPQGYYYDRGYPSYYHAPGPYYYYGGSPW